MLESHNQSSRLRMLRMALLLFFCVGCGSTSEHQSSRAQTDETEQNDPQVLRVTLTGASSSQGNYACAVFDSQENFDRREHPIAAKNLDVPNNNSESVVWEIDDLPQGRYAIGVFHDKNENGKLDRHMLGYPVEAYGFSNNARGRVGPPPFEQAAFNFALTDLELEIRLK